MRLGTVFDSYISNLEMTPLIINFVCTDKLADDSNKSSNLGSQPISQHSDLSYKSIIPC